MKDEPAAARIEAEWLSQPPAISSINLGETLYMRIRERGEKAAVADISTIHRNSLVIDPDWALVTAAAGIKAGGGMSYADAFCAATAARVDAPLWTGDPELIDRAEQLPCRIVDLRS
ncbi:MAG TPA: PIN domain-containing protein [Solirubrobacterales bacterium]|nr:PIN domain-containing protein [Solirubrobacterales bacterium]